MPQFLKNTFQHLVEQARKPLWRRFASARASVCKSLRASAIVVLSATLPLSLAVADPVVGEPAADFALRALGAANVRLSEHRGEVVLLNFWATWCGPCRQEMPLLNDLHTKYQRAGLTLLGVNIDATAAAAGEMARGLKVTYPILIDERQEVGKLYRIDSMPLTVLIDRQGVVRYVSQGFQPGYEQRYADWLRELLND